MSTIRLSIISSFILLILANQSIAADKIKIYFNNEEVSKMIEVYSRASGQKFIIDPAVKGKVSIFIQEPVEITEAFNHLSSALAIHGIGMIKQNDTYIVRNAKKLQRDLIEVGTETPNPTPERMYTWIYTVRNMPASQLMRNLKILPSKDGEMNVNENTNQIIFTDWSSNIVRISTILKEVDKPNSADIEAILEAEKKKLKK